MKKYTVQIIVLVVLAGIVIAAQFAPYGTSRLFDMLRIGKKATIEELRDFSIADTAKVDRIFLVDKESRTIDLTRNENNQWLVNGQHDADKHSVNRLLETMKRMTIKNPVARSAEENILKRLATKSVKVEVYQGGSIEKIYYIGGVTQNQQGTYAMIEGSDKPFVIEMPGFRGYLSSRFHTSERTWRSSKVFAFAETEIDEISVNVGRVSSQSFSVKVKGKNNYELYNDAHALAKQFDTIVVRRFVREFNRKFFSSYVPFVNEKMVDSVYRSPYLYRYKVSLNDGREVNLSVHKIQDYVADELDEVGLLNGIINQTEWVNIQTHIFAPMFKELDDFRPEF